MGNERKFLILIIIIIVWMVFKVVAFVMKYQKLHYGNLGIFFFMLEIMFYQQRKPQQLT